MSEIDSTLLDCAGSIQGPLETLHAARDELLRFMESELAQIEALHQRVEARATELDGRERRLEVQEQHVELQQVQNDKSTQQLEAERAQVEALKAELDASAGAASTDDRVEELHRQADELRGQITSLSEQARAAELRADQAQKQLDEALGQIAAPNGSLANRAISPEAVDEIAELTTQLSQVREELGRRSDAGPVDPELADRMATLEHERTALESELELVRGRAAELSETAAAQQRMIAEERAEWADELKQMRRALERQTQSVSAVETQVNTPTAEPAAASQPAAPAGPPDAVLESIRAQFEQVQRDRARRRDQHGDKGSSNVAVL